MVISMVVCFDGRGSIVDGGLVVVVGVGFDGWCFDSVYLVGLVVFGDALCSCVCGFL